MAVQESITMSGFPCKLCGIVCTSVSILLEHIDGNHQEEDEERKYKCDECGRGYRHAGSLANHKKTHEVGSFECHVCGKENSNASALKSHLRSHTSPKKYSCEECGKAFRLASQLTTHARVHMTKRTKKETEDLNHLSHEIKEDLPHRNHEQETSSSQLETCDEEENRPFKCDLCDKSYIHQRSLNYHKKTHQLGKFDCPVCFKRFNNMPALYSHQRIHKEKDKTEFSLSPESYKESTNIQFSPQGQGASENFCHLCEILLPDSRSFQEHIQMHNSSSEMSGVEKIATPHQKASYDSGEAYDTNYDVPTVSRDNISYAVDENRAYDHHAAIDSPDDETSSRYFKRKGQVANAIVDDIMQPLEQETTEGTNVTKTATTGSDERPFKCHICGKSYRHSGSLINHKRSHQVGIFKCSVCKKNYPHLAALKSHLRLHKGRSRSLGIRTRSDWLSAEPQVLSYQQDDFSAPDEQADEPDVSLDHDQESGDDEASYMEQFQPNYSQGTPTDLPHDEDGPHDEDEGLQRHMCADCGETFPDIEGIKAHSCPLLQQRHQNESVKYVSRLSSSCDDVENLASTSLYQGMSDNLDQEYFGEAFADDVSSALLNSVVDKGHPIQDDEEEDEEEEEEDGELYQCSLCHNSYTTMKALRIHLRGHTQNSDNPGTSGPSSMSSHDGERDVEPGHMVICSTCGESFANTQDLINHQDQHKEPQDILDHFPLKSDVSENKEDEQIICGSCGVSCMTYDHLDNHDCAAGRKEEPVECKQEVSDVVQHKETSLSRETTSPKDRRYKCDQCGHSYRHSASLLNHKKSHKTGVFRCLVCQKRYYNLLALKNHHRSHFDVKRHTCQECGKAFKIQKQLLIHQRRHIRNQAKMQELQNRTQSPAKSRKTRSNGKIAQFGSKASQTRNSEGEETATKVESSGESENSGDRRPYACDQCGRTYRHAGSLANHRKSHKTGEFYCSVCNNSYSNQLAMKNHMRTHFFYRKHTCQKCGKKFRAKKQLLAHVCTEIKKEVKRRIAKTKLYKCKSCKKAFLSVDQLSNHTCDASSHGDAVPEERPFKCGICGRSYRHAGSLLNHKNTHKTGHFNCTFCFKPFTNPMALRNHTRIHTQKKKYTCTTCGKAFRLASILHNHQRIHSRVPSHFSCSSCGRSFQGRSSFKRHNCRGQGSSALPGEQRAKAADKCFKCDLCGRSYRHAGSLFNHKKSHSENLHNCALCLQSFPDYVSLQKHSQMRRHSCPVCSKTFCLTAHLQSHMETHSKAQAGAHGQEHQNSLRADLDAFQDNSGISPRSGIPKLVGSGETPNHVEPALSHISQNLSDSEMSPDCSASQEKSHVCDHCGRCYRHAGSLLNHKNSHKTGSFFCAVCQKEFTNLLALKNHQRIHTEPKRYQCLQCGKAFRVSSQLICHRRIHTKEKPFTCQVCHKSFSNNSNLRHHEKIHKNSAQTCDSFFSLDTLMDLDIDSFL